MKNIIHHSVLTIIVIIGISSCSHLGYDVIDKKTTVNLPSFDSNYRYKRLVINNNNEIWVASSSRDDEYTAIDYYSADSGVITFNNSRLVAYSTAKPIRNWSEQSTLFSWKKLIQGTPQTIKRCIVDHPQNAVDNCQSRVLRVIDTVPPTGNQLVTASEVFWVQEMPQSKYYNNNKQNIYYAIRKRDNKPIYGQLYLDDDTHVTWQDWEF